MIRKNYGETDPTSLGTIILELEKGYYIYMDNGKDYLVHPKEFERFGGLFQVIGEREAKISWLHVN